MHKINNVTAGNLQYIINDCSQHETFGEETSGHDWQNETAVLP